MTRARGGDCERDEMDIWDAKGINASNDDDALRVIVRAKDFVPKMRRRFGRHGRLARAGHHTNQKDTSLCVLCRHVEVATAKEKADCFCSIML